jgi:hypothetical protein
LEEDHTLNKNQKRNLRKKIRKLEAKGKQVHEEKVEVKKPPK